MIKKAKFISVWDGGCKVITNCKVNMKTHNIFDIEKVDIEGLEILDAEYITIDGKDYPVSNVTEEDNINKSNFWYELN